MLNVYDQWVEVRVRQCSYFASFTIKYDFMFAFQLVRINGQTVRAPVQSCYVVLFSHLDTTDAHWNPTKATRVHYFRISVRTPTIRYSCSEFIQTNCVSTKARVYLVNLLPTFVYSYWNANHWTHISMMLVSNLTISPRADKMSKYDNVYAARTHNMHMCARHFLDEMYIYMLWTWR